MGDLDDLFPADSNQAKAAQEKTLIELVRIVGDNMGRARVQGNEVLTREPRCGVLVTGEYLIGSGSDAARLLPIKFLTPISNAKLSECQAEPLALSTFYFHYLTWFISNYDSIQDWLAGALLKSRGTHLGVHDRLQETYFCLGSAYRIFLQYCLDKNFISAKNAQGEYRSFKHLLTALVMKQDKEVRKGGGVKAVCDVDLFELIRTLYNGKQFHLANDISRLNKKHHGFTDSEFLYLRGGRMMDEVLKFAPKATYNTVTDALIAQDALKVGNEKRSVQIRSPQGNTRFYAISLKKLRR